MEAIAANVKQWDPQFLPLVAPKPDPGGDEGAGGTAGDQSPPGGSNSESEMLSFSTFDIKQVLHN